MLPEYPRLADFDPEVASAIAREAQRQEDHIELIASENYVSAQVLRAQGSVLTNKYAEGYPHKRYYGGCQYVDEVEDLAIARAKALFGADYVNVQPHSGSQANAAAFFALLQPGDVILGMDLAHGGHLTHGSKVNFSGKLYQAHSYGVDPVTGLVDYDRLAEQVQQLQPRMLVTGFSAYSRVLDWVRLRKIADSVGAYLFADIAHVAGLVAVGLYPSPLPYADVVTTTTHKTLRGPRGGMIMARENAEISKKLNSAVFPGQQGGPLMHVIAAKAVAFKEALEPAFKAYQMQVIENARTMVEVLLRKGYEIVSGGTDNHLFLINLTDKGITGKEAEEALDVAFITTNKNTVPNEQRSPFVTSGLRIGTPAVTTRGFKTSEVQALAEWVCHVLAAPHDEAVLTQTRANVKALCARFPVYSPKVGEV
jgi:glycine hydroxymethyltransferase